MHVINGLVWLCLPASLAFFARWRIAERDATHYRDLLIKTHAELTYIKYDMKDPKWDDNYKKDKNAKKQQ